LNIFPAMWHNKRPHCLQKRRKFYTVFGNFDYFSSNINIGGGGMTSNY
jgi:hypothetical protein